MRNDKNFKIYTPDEKPYGKAMYLQSEKGEDWYQVQDKYLPDTVKIEYEADGTIIRTSNDVSTLVPVGRSVVEIKSLPDGFEDGEWMFDGKSVRKKVKSHEQLIAEAEKQKQALISAANQKTQLWQTQLMLGIITEEDKASLKEWMLYVQKVQVVDPSLGAGVVWPTPPVSQAS
ncbi:tail fiber assembly protein [Morganella morganii]|uniref:tail fiber assembly protein n=1 Tax=Morganella morganii TaxID=582 RepID=UPI0033331578